MGRSPDATTEKWRYLSLPQSSKPPPRTGRAMNLSKFFDRQRVPERSAHLRDAPFQSGTDSNCRIAISGLRKEFNRLVKRLGIPHKADVGWAEEAIAVLRERVTTVLKARALTVSALSREGRDITAWLEVFGDIAELRGYLGAVARADSALRSEIGLRLRFPRPYCIEFRPMRGLYRLQATSSLTRVICPSPMVVFDTRVFSCLAALISGRNRDRESLYRAMTGKDYQTLRHTLDSSAGDAEPGVVHHLESAFERVNCEYFGGAMSRPTIQWAKAASSRKLGSFDPIGDRVTISALLDRPAIPSFVVDFVLYHELLHRKHGVEWRRGRAHVHTRLFREDERRFVRVEEARTLIDALGKRKP